MVNERQHIKTTPGVEAMVRLYLKYWDEFVKGSGWFTPEEAIHLTGRVACRLPRGRRTDTVNKAWYEFLVAKSKALHLPEPFESDAQCTLVPDFVHRRYCIFHDFLYWRGGTLQDQIDADLFLGVCSDYRAELARNRVTHWLMHLWGRMLSGGTVAFGRSHFVERMLP